MMCVGSLASSVGTTQATPPSDPPDMTDRYNTALTDGEEQQYQTWAAKNGHAGDTRDYDLRGAWKAGAGQAGNGHFPDTFKKPNHPTFSSESQYSGVDGYTGGTWTDLGNDKWAYKPSATNLQMRSPDQLRQYFQRVEPGSQLDIPATGSDLARTVHHKRGGR